MLEFVERFRPDDGMLVKGEDRGEPSDDGGCMLVKLPPKLQGTAGL